MSEVLRHTHPLPATPGRVWAVLSDVLAWPRWLPTVLAVDPEDPGAPPGVGARYAVRQPRLGTATWQVTDWRPDRGFVWVSRRPGVRSTATHELTALGPDSTQLTLAIGWSGPLARPARAAYGRMTARYLATEAAALAARLAHPA